MHRTTIGTKQATAFFYCVAILIGAIGASRAQAQNILEIRKIEGPVHHLVYRGSVDGNFDNNMIVSAGEDGILLVDHRNTVDNSVLGFIEATFGETVDFAVNTHWHPDHTNGNRWFPSEVVIFAHKNTHTRRVAPQNPSWAPNGLAALPNHALPDVATDAELSIRFNNETIELHALPVGHTDSDILVLFTKSKIAAIGDVFNGRGQISGFDYFSGDPRGYLAELDFAITLLSDDYVVVTGHGDPSSRNEIIEYRALYAALLDELDHRRKRGLSANKAAQIGLPNIWRQWLSDTEFDDSGDWLLQTTRRLWANAERNNADASQ